MQHQKYYEKLYLYQHLSAQMLIASPKIRYFVSSLHKKACIWVCYNSWKNKEKTVKPKTNNHLAMNLVKWNLDFFSSSSSGPPSSTLYFTPCMIIILKSYVKSTPFHDIIANSVHNDFRTFFFSPPVQNLLLKLSMIYLKKKNATQTIFVMTKQKSCLFLQ